MSSRFRERRREWISESERTVRGMMKLNQGYSKVQQGVGRGSQYIVHDVIGKSLLFAVLDGEIYTE